MLALSIAAGMIPMLAFLAVVWWLDRYDREPIWLVGLVFLWGAVFAAGGSYITNSIGHVVLSLALANSINAEWISIMFVAPLVEEPLKGIISRRSRLRDVGEHPLLHSSRRSVGVRLVHHRPRSNGHLRPHACSRHIHHRGGARLGEDTNA